jgi:hypothetical protein
LSEVVYLGGWGKPYPGIRSIRFRDEGKGGTMPRIALVTGNADVAAEHHGDDDDVVTRGLRAGGQDYTRFPLPYRLHEVGLASRPTATTTLSMKGRVEPAPVR